MMEECAPVMLEIAQKIFSCKKIEEEILERSIYDVGKLRRGLRFAHVFLFSSHLFRAKSFSF
jgi:hypothetical protein